MIGVMDDGGSHYLAGHIAVQPVVSRAIDHIGYLPHEVAAAGPLVFVSNYGNGHVRSSDLTDDPGNALSVVDDDPDGIVFLPG